MAFEAIFKGGNIVTGLAIGIGGALVVPIILPALGGLLRPAAKAVIKGGIVAYDWGREVAAQVGEATSDVVAEARIDAKKARAAPGTATVMPGEAAAV